MRFEEALQAMRAGNKVKLGDYIYFIEEKTIWKHHISNDFKLLGHLYYDEIMSEDWRLFNTEY